MPVDPLLLQGAILFVLLALSAFFSMSETALISTDRLELRNRADKGDPRAQRLEQMLEDPERLLTTILLGNNLVNIAATAVATAAALTLFPTNYAVAASTAIMTVVVLIFAEITPKSLAVRRSLGVALIVGAPLKAVETVLWPFVILLGALSKGILRLLGLKADADAPFITQAQIESLVRMGVHEGEVEKFEERVITEVFEFTDTDVEEVMTDRDKVHYLTKEVPMRTALELSAKTGHSRLPVVDGDFDHVLGFVHVKDLLKYTDGELATEPITDILRGVLFTQYDTGADKVLVRMQREHKLMAIIQNEDGRNIGIATAEDLLEELVGEIHDEFDKGIRSGT